MSKSTFFTGQPIFSQLLSFLNRGRIHKIASDLGSDHYYKSFKTYEHLVTMLYCIFNRCNSLREVVTGLQVWEHRIVHLGINYHPRKSTISDANSQREASVFGDIYSSLYNQYRHFLPDSRTKASQLYIADSTTISLFQEVLRNAGRSPVHGKRKGGIKVHTLMRSDEDVPRLIRMSAAAASDSPFLNEINLPEGSILVVDRGYNSYHQWNRLTDAKVTWVSRLRSEAVYRIIEKCEISQAQQSKGVLNDCIIELGHEHRKNNPRVKARLIEYCDPDSKEVFYFISNGFRYAPATIAGFYRKRWQIEILFKRVKQNYPLRNFLGESENAIKIQVWCALIADLLLKIVKANAARKWSFSNLASMVRIHLMTYIDLFAFLRNPERTLHKYPQQAFQQSLFPT